MGIDANKVIDQLQTMLSNANLQLALARAEIEQLKEGQQDKGQPEEE